MARTRKQQLKFHIQSDDYFGTLATVINLAREALENKATSHATRLKSLQILNTLKNDLLFLQKHYRIVEKKKRSFSAGGSAV